MSAHPLTEMERKLQGLEDQLLRQHHQAEAAASENNFAVGPANSAAASVPINQNSPNDPMWALLYRMERKIESLQCRMGGRPAVSNFPAAATMASPHSPTAAAASAAPPASGKRKRGRPRSPWNAQQKQPYVEEYTSVQPSKNNDDNDDNLDANNDAVASDDTGNNVTDNCKRAKSSPRINWAKSPHRERLARVLHDWWSRSGLAIDDETGEPILCHRKYSRKVGIARTTLFKYLHKDPSKRRIITAEGESYGRRGKKPLIDDEGARLIVDQLKGKAEATNEGFSREEVVSMVMEQVGLSRTAASRQVTRRILPKLMKDGMTLLGEEATTLEDEEEDQHSQHQQSKRSIVISGVTVGLGRVLFRYYCDQGHDVAGCGCDLEEIHLLQLEFPNAKLSVVNVADDDAVARWAAELEGSGMKVDVVIANAAICPETDIDKPAWEVPRFDFDDTIDVNVKGVSNMVRHFVPWMIRTRCAEGSEGHIGGGGTLVAMSSDLGRSPNSHHAAYCASKFAVEGMIKSVAMSLPAPLCAVPLAPGRMTPAEEGKKTTKGVSNDVHRWVDVTGPMILRLNRKDNGRSLSVKGFYSVRDRQTWIIQDGTGVQFNEVCAV
mmetsp:Transcript_7468/g.16292  ORF Transcript_7468/g.16292 Transcript_7468/m.16292 type:complete len:608 (+) Transcript_7468:120-1943(+)|eukprot:CAMPEP_0172530320 /NCGR_PEP_ID=MMETSP1067-20121228/4083_1 /TAXON_ID=265564 ORGANISM="Thalassiosira punctigera, Strain Tpunct2005C2" /NCGR_SAMPLE_ID=MMETSP1067 /ASSEMBLY_ACC=CAM_ASM_000444 /LENGTH=607 /DNA_ID=CAMNT_0013314499 /DNA_START=108 /DNA_END=1931 /DNA_ORIENTATION=-